MVCCDLNKSFEEHVSILEEIEDNFRETRQSLVRSLVHRLQSREQEWEATFRDILKRSQEESKPTEKDQISSFLSPASFSTPTNITHTSRPETRNNAILTPIKEVDEPKTPTHVERPKVQTPIGILPKSDPATLKLNAERDRRQANKEFCDPCFSNSYALKEFVRIQEILNLNRLKSNDFRENPTNKSYKNELNIFIRTQINAISNNDAQHLSTKIKLLSNLFNGSPVEFQGRMIDVNRHPEARLFALDLAAQTFVTVGTRLVNSVPAIARSMATVIMGVVDNNIPIFRDLIIGHLQERCPFIVPMYPDPDDLKEEKDLDIKHKIASGYIYDSKTQTLETEDKYQARMRSIVLIYACILSQGPVGLSWSWLVSFLSLYPEPVITATVLQAYLQEGSKKLSSTYGRQYDKLLSFIKTKYLSMIEEVTPKNADRQSLIKLKNLLSDENNLIAPVPITSIFGSIKYTH